MKFRFNSFSFPVFILLLFCMHANAQERYEIYVGFHSSIPLTDSTQPNSFLENWYLENPAVPIPLEASFSFNFSKNKDLQHIVRFRFASSDDCSKAITQAVKSPWVRFAEHVPLNKRFLTPNDLGSNSTSNGGQWYHYKIQAQQAWDLQTGSNSVRVAVIDDAVQTNHPDLEGVCLPGFDAAEFDMDVEPPTPAHDHGTHVSGLIAALTDNAVGMASLAHGVRIMPVKVTFDNNPDNVASGFEGIAWAVSNGADIINCSWGSESFSQTGLAVIQDAQNTGAIVIAAAGNFNNSIVQYPAGYDGVIAVGATTSSDARSSFSSYGTWVDVSAPGSQIWSLAPNDGYQLKNGTSFAAPLVSALAALLKSNNPNLTSAEIEACIKGSAEDISFLNSGFNGLIGAGRINAYEAIRCVQLENAAYNVALEFETALPDRLCTGSLSPVVRISNTGSQTLNTLTLRAQLGNEPPNFYTIDTILLQGESMLLPMQAITPSPGNQNYRVQLVGLLNGQHADVYSPDNLLQHAIVVIGGLGEPLPFTENFESGTFATNNWLIINEDDAFSWSINSAVSPEPGSNAAMLGYFVNPAIGSRDYLQTPPLDFSGVGSATLQFDFAYMPRFQNISDSLIVSYSTDCGNTFIRLIELSGTTLATTQAFPDNFLAQESELWCGASNFAACYSSATDVLAGNTNVILRWEGYCNNGNNIFIDNISIEGSTTNAPPQAAFDANWDLPACVGKLVQFQNESTGYPTSYFWTFAGGNPNESSLENPEITYTLPGIYPVRLIATNNNGSDTLLVNQFIEAVELPQLTISTSSDTICGGNTAQLIASGASYYYWNSGPAMSATVGDSVNVSPQSNATYLVNGVSAEGCSASASQSIYVVSQPSIPSITVDGAYLVASPGIGYEWYLNGVLLANETNQTLLPQQNGNYNVRVYIQDDCSSISAVFPVNFAGMSEKNESEVFVVFPNPADKQLMVKLKESVQCIKAFDMVGNCVFVSTSCVSTIETATWSAGLYSIAVFFDNGKTTSRQIQIIH